MDEIQKLKNRIKELEKALEWFAMAAPFRHTGYNSWAIFVTEEDLDRARRALGFDNV